MHTAIFSFRIVACGQWTTMNMKTVVNHSSVIVLTKKLNSKFLPEIINHNELSFLYLERRFTCHSSAIYPHQLGIRPMGDSSRRIRGTRRFRNSSRSPVWMWPANSTKRPWSWWLRRGVASRTGSDSALTPGQSVMRCREVDGRLRRSHTASPSTRSDWPRETWIRRFLRLSTCGATTRTWRSPKSIRIRCTSRSGEMKWDMPRIWGLLGGRTVSHFNSRCSAGRVGKMIHKSSL